MKIPLITPIAVTLLVSAVQVSALDISLTPAAGMSQESIDGFHAAANYWESVLSDNATVNIDIDFTALSPGVLGQASSETQSTTVSAYFTALGGDSTSASDAAALANLPALSVAGGLSYNTQIFNSGTNTLVLGFDNDDSANNRVLNLNTSTAKALGLFGGGAGDSDASITFSSEFT